MGHSFRFGDSYRIYRVCEFDTFIEVDYYKCKTDKKYIDYIFAAPIRKMVKTREEAVVDEGAEDVVDVDVVDEVDVVAVVDVVDEDLVDEGAEYVRGSIELQLFSVQLKHTG